MNIENNLYNAKKALDLARDKIDQQDYDTAIEVLASSYSHVRELLQQVYKLKALKVEVEGPANEKSGKE